MGRRSQSEGLSQRLFHKKEFHCSQCVHALCVWIWPRSSSCKASLPVHCLTECRSKQIYPPVEYRVYIRSVGSKPITRPASQAASPPSQPTSPPIQPPQPSQPVSSQGQGILLILLISGRAWETYSVAIYGDRVHFADLIDIPHSKITKSLFAQTVLGSCGARVRLAPHGRGLILKRHLA